MAERGREVKPALDAASRATLFLLVDGGYTRRSPIWGGTPAVTSAPRKQSTKVMFGSVETGVL